MIKFDEHIAELAKQGAVINNCGSMCSDCAFKFGTDANEDEKTQISVMDCLAYYQPFYCHQPDAVAQNRLCVGYCYAKQFLELQELEKDPNHNIIDVHFAPLPNPVSI